jgi:flagellar M-ring protein FliF
VDVTLDMDRVRVTTEDVLAAPDLKGGAATGVLVRERESARDGAAPDARSAQGSSMQRDTEYQAGRRVEQLVNQPGAVRRLQVVALVRQPLGEAQREELRRLVGAAVGAVMERGDSVVVQAVGAVATPVGVENGAPALHAQPAEVAQSVEASWVGPARRIAIVSLLLVVAVWAIVRRARPRAHAMAALGHGERQRALQQVHAWLAQGAAPVPVTDAAPAQGAQP